VFRKGGKHKIGFDRVADDRGYNHITALAVGGLDLEILCSGR
jgi:hypothetical protein